MDWAKRIGDRVRALRTKQGLTLELLSAASGVPPESISRIERARTTATVPTLAKLADGLGVTASALLAEDEPASGRHGAEVGALGVAAMLKGRSPATIDAARRVVAVLVELDDAARTPPA